MTSDSKRPSFDSNGYPTDETLREVRNWPATEFWGLIRYVEEAFKGYGSVKIEDGLVKMATGGWSGNEEIARAIRENTVFWTMYWQSSHRGGLDVFRIPDYDS